MKTDKTVLVDGTIKSIESFVSMTVYKIEFKGGRVLDYTIFGLDNSGYQVGEKLSVSLGFSIFLNGYTIRYIGQNKKAA